jgi:hypothetical protein
MERSVKITTNVDLNLAMFLILEYFIRVRICSSVNPNHGSATGRQNYGPYLDIIGLVGKKYVVK